MLPVGDMVAPARAADGLALVVVEEPPVDDVEPPRGAFDHDRVGRDLRRIGRRRALAIQSCVSEGWLRSARVRRNAIVLVFAAAEQRRLLAEDVAVERPVVECFEGHSRRIHRLLHDHVRQEGVDRRLPIVLVDVQHVDGRVFAHERVDERRLLRRRLDSGDRPVDRSVAVVDGELRFEGRVAEHRDRERRRPVIGAIAVDLSPIEPARFGCGSYSSRACRHPGQ